MVAKEFLDYINQYNFVHSIGIYDIFDKCVYILTFSIILICSAAVTVKSYILDPMSCYVATNVEGANNLAYINNFCWISGTVTRDVHHGSHDDDEYWKGLESKKIYYYQWVPLVLGLQAAIIYLPYVIWQCLIYNRLGTNLQGIVDMARRASLDYGPSRQGRVARVSNHLYVLLMSRKRKQAYLNSIFNKNVEIVFFYGLLKVASFIIISLQFVLMEKFLNINGRHRLFGITLLQDIIAGHHWSKTALFPRMGFCRVPFKVNHSPTVNVLAQCTLSVNMLNEKIFIFLWWWFSVVAALQIIGLFLWLKRCVLARSRVAFVNNVVLVNNRLDSYGHQLVTEFDRDILAMDGCFLIHMLRINCGDLICNEIVDSLLDMYKSDDRMPSRGTSKRVSMSPFKDNVKLLFL